MRKRNVAHGRALKWAGTAVTAVVLTWQSTAVAADGPATADRSDEVIEDRMRAGIIAYRKQDFETARKAFAEAWRVKQHGTIAASLAQVEMKLGQFQAAAEHWAYYLESLGSEPSRSRAETETALAECRKHLGVLVVNINVPGAAVILDGEEVKQLVPPKELWVQRTTHRELWVAPGAHRVHARAGKRESPAVEVSVPVSQTSTIELVVPDDGTASGGADSNPYLANAPPPKEKEHSSGLTPRTLVLASGVGLAVASAITGVVFSFKAGSKFDEVAALQRSVDASPLADPELVKINGTCAAPPERLPPDCAALDTAADAHTRFQNIAFYSYVAAGTFAVATVATYFLWPARKTDRGQTAITIAPWVDGVNRGARVGLSF